MSTQDGIITLADETKLRLKILVVDAREVGFSPYGGVNIIVKPVGGLKVEHIPNNLKEQVADKPPAPTTEVPYDGWEIIDIDSFEPAVSELDVNTSKGVFRVTVKAEPVMAARNMNYKVAPELNEPLYHVNWVYKISWKPVTER
jgi:hypothetical protein